MSATALQDVAGIGPVITAGVLDVAKGTIGPLLARPAATPVSCRDRRRRRGHRGTTGRPSWVVPAAAGSHRRRVRSWSRRPREPRFFSRASPPVASSGRLRSGALAADAAPIPILSRTRGRAGAVAAAAVPIPMLVKRLVGNRRAATPSTYLYRLLLDRDQCSKS
ncbi:MAG TPA: hypothetical protein VFI46_18760 [Jiangellaceae bacterium]|nr:hypothetical protein [Jiangellaceae bacterium]